MVHYLKKIHELLSAYYGEAESNDLSKYCWALHEKDTLKSESWQSIYKDLKRFIEDSKELPLEKAIKEKLKLLYEEKQIEEAKVKLARYEITEEESETNQAALNQSLFFKESVVLREGKRHNSDAIQGKKQLSNKRKRRCSYENFKSSSAPPSPN